MNARRCKRETCGGGEKFESLTGTTARLRRMTVRAGLSDGFDHAELVHKLAALPRKGSPTESAGAPAADPEVLLRRMWPNAVQFRCESTLQDVVVASACR